MAFDFPASPSEGQEFTPPVAGAPTYVYESPRWKAKGITPGVTVSDTPPSNPVQGQLWLESDTGNLFAYWNDGSSAAWVQVSGNPAAQEYIASTAADMRAGFAAGPNLFTVNDKADGTGTNVMTVSETGTITSAGDLSIAGGYIYGASPHLVLGTAAASGIVYLRPNGAADATGQTTVDSAGKLSVNGDIGCSTILWGGYMYSGGNVVIGANSNNLHFRPYGPANGTNEMYLDTGGVLTVTTAVIANNGNIVAGATGYKPGGGPWNASSDARIKTVNGPYTQGLDAVLALNPVRYHYKDNLKLKADDTIKQHASVMGKEFIGLIAQEAEIPMPEMVTLSTGFIDGVEVDDLRDLDTNALLFALVNAVKELSAKVEALEGAP